MTKKHQPHAAAAHSPPPLKRVTGCPTEPGDYRIKVRDNADDGVILPVVQTIDSMDEEYVYGRPQGFWGMAGFKIGRSTIEWHERLP